MSLSLSILASGSAGNCGLLRFGSRLMLIDCGIGPRSAAGRMKELGVSLLNVEAICLTHLDRDHFNINWTAQIIRQGIRVYCHRDRAEELKVIVDEPAFSELVYPFNCEAFEILEGLCFRPIRFAHDQHGSHGFAIECELGRIGYATDLGRVHGQLIEHFRGVNLLAIESNYDPKMQQESARPLFLKQRITGGRGHLSNQEAFAAVLECLDRSHRAGQPLPDHIVLLHRSQQCNCPNLVRELFASDVRIADRLVLAEQDRPTGWLHVRHVPAFVGAQLELKWG